MSLSRLHGCPKGTTLRKSYTRIFRNHTVKKGYTVRRKGTLFVVHPSTHPVRVPAHCVRSRKALSSRIGSLRKGDLLRFGYQYRLSDAKRRKALKKAMEHYGTTSVYHKLDAVAKLSVTSAPDASIIFSRDRNWVRGQIGL
jgi:hypothetical protein